VGLTDPAFFGGMEKDGSLNDTPTDWDPLFRNNTTTNPIHGVLKVAGSSPTQVKQKLEDIKSDLGYSNTIIKGVSGISLPSDTPSIIEGEVRPRALKLNGKEQ
jgi:hypothetical protein